jgi:hypothetical protein
VERAERDHLHREQDQPLVEELEERAERDHLHREQVEEGFDQL